MKRSLLSLAVVILGSVGAFGQGTVFFQNSASTAVSTASTSLRFPNPRRWR